MTGLSRCARRGFLATLSTSIAGALAVACHDEPMVVVDKPVDPPPESFDYGDVVEAYFGEEGLADASFVGGYYADSVGFDADAAFEATQPAVEAIDAATSLESVLDDLDEALQQDFVDLRVVDVAGWTLGQTEVNLCLLAWLVAS